MQAHHLDGQTRTGQALPFSAPPPRAVPLAAPAVRPVLLRLPDVLARTGLGKSMVYALMAKGDFPSSVKIGPRVTAWLEGEVDAWVADRVAAARGGKL
ncbi:helix-turn-helix transcriptional regulator [Roseateles sp. DB2]|uniref:helix-turn-helix transcriptional regulator n=1 Tax=Roseateles sp. DB2 TaxID=3453717 RepID=UPI003EE9E334